MRSPSPIRRRLNTTADVPHRPGAGVASVLYLAAEALAFLAIIAVWLLWWSALPAGAAEAVNTATVCKGTASIFLGGILLGIAFLLLRAIRRGAP